MSNLNPGAWLGILKWSLAQSDGTREAPSDVRPMSAEDAAWLQAALASVTVDEAARMRELAAVLAPPPAMTKPRSTRSAESSGGQRSRVVRTASTIAAIVSASASRISWEVT